LALCIVAAHCDLFPIVGLELYAPDGFA